MKNKKNENLYIAKHDDFVLAKYSFNLETSKLLNVISLRASSNFKDSSPITDINGNVRSYLYSFDFEDIKKDAKIERNIETKKKDWTILFKDLTSKVIIFNGEEGYEGLGINEIKGVPIFKEFKVNKETKKLILEIDIHVKKYLFDRIAYRKLNKYSPDYMYYCSSKYSFRLYEILIHKIKKVKDKNKVFNVILDVNELKKILVIPKSYQFGMINERILKKAYEDFNATAYKEEPEKQDKYRLFKSFEYSPIEDITHKRGKKPTKSIKFTFELLQDTIFTMMTDKEKENINLNKEDSFYNMVEFNIKMWIEEKPFLNKRSVSEVFEEIIQIYEEVKEEFGVIGTIDPIAVKKTIEFTFRTVKTYDNFYFFFKKNLISNIEFEKEKKEKKIIATQNRLFK